MTIDQKNFLKIEVQDEKGESFIWIAQDFVGADSHDRGPGIQLSEAQARELLSTLQDMLDTEEEDEL